MMNKRVKALSVLGFAIAGLGLLSFAVQPAAAQSMRGATKQKEKENKKDDEKKAKINEKAPDFTLRDLEGKEYKLSDYKDKIVVLEWINPACPYVQQAYQKKIMKNMYDELESMFGEENIVFLSINSTADISKDSVIQSQKSFNKLHKIERPVLVDYEGEVGKTYKARTTPHMYVIDREGILRYEGALSDDKWSRKAEDERTNYVINALTKMKAGETVAPDHVKPWGCSVKYKRN